MSRAKATILCIDDHWNGLIGRKMLLEQPLSPWQLFRQRLRRRKIAMAGGAILVFLYAVALFAGFIAPYNYQRQDRDRFFHPPIWPRLQGLHLVVPRYEAGNGTFVYRCVPNDTAPLHFFIRGDKYNLFGLIPASLHLSGTGDSRYPVYLLGTDQAAVPTLHSSGPMPKAR